MKKFDLQSLQTVAEYSPTVRYSTLYHFQIATDLSMAMATELGTK